MSQQPSTKVTANGKCQNIASTNVTANDKCHNFASTNVTANDKCRNFASANVTANDKCHNSIMITNDKCHNLPTNVSRHAYHLDRLSHSFIGRRILYLVRDPYYLYFLKVIYHPLYSMNKFVTNKSKLPQDGAQVFPYMGWLAIMWPSERVTW